MSCTRRCTRCNGEVHAVASFAEQRLDRLLVLAVLALLEVADGDDGLLSSAEQLLEPREQARLGDLAPHVAAELELAEDVLAVERREARVELVLLLDVQP